MTEPLLVKSTPTIGLMKRKRSAKRNSSRPCAALKSCSTSYTPAPTAMKLGSWARAAHGASTPRQRPSTSAAVAARPLLQAMLLPHKNPPRPHLSVGASQSKIGSGCSEGQAFQPLHRRDQPAADARLHRGVSGIGHDDVLGLRPGTRELVGTLDRADHVVTALDDGGGDATDRRQLRHQVGLGRVEMV